MTKKPKEPREWGEGDEPQSQQDAGAYDERPHRDQRDAPTQYANIAYPRTAVVTYATVPGGTTSGSATFLIKQIPELEAQLSHQGDTLNDILAITIS
jgi:hypothetical protein